MDTVLLSASCILSALSLVVTLILLFKFRHGTGQIDDKALRRIEERLDAAANLTEYTSRGLENLSRATEQRLAFMQKTLADDIKYIVDANAQNLERIRRTVDEKLTASVDGKLSESYARISERLEKMYESVGEMKSVSGNIADIRRVFVNVKLRGTWGEAQLDALLAQTLAPGQYERSVKVDPAEGSLVDFAIVLPSKDGERILLPVDSKFPVEEFERLVSASERGDRAAEETARKNLERAVKAQADSIAKKYIRPPRTTDFAVMFLPSEGLYAEVVRTEGLSDFLHARRVLVCGPTNLGALLSTLQTGFRTAAIEKRSGELRQMLEQFRHDFKVFSESLEKTYKKLQEAQDAVDAAKKRTNNIGRRLDSFRGDALPPEDDEE